LATSNASVARQYLKAVESLGPPEDVAAFYGPDMVFQEFPNRIAPQGRIRRAGDLSAAYQKGQQLLRSQTYAVQRILEAGDEVAVELEMDRSPIDFRDEFARGERDESIRRNVSHLPRWQDYFAAKLRLLSPIRSATRFQRSGVKPRYHPRMSRPHQLTRRRSAAPIAVRSPSSMLLTPER
jgi:hypothetical protein